MILKRKIYDKLLSLKKTLNGKKAVLIEGARRIGKSTICEEFGKNEYKSYILIDFSRCPDEVKNYFVKHMNDLNTFFMLLSTYYGVKLYERESLIIFDEVQMYPKARECIKYLVADERYDYLETGSLISIKENVRDIVIPSEERHLKMYPLDFEEFCDALGEAQIISYIIEVKSGKKYSIESLKRFKEKYRARIGECYVIHPRNLSFKEDILCIPPYMTICL